MADKVHCMYHLGKGKRIYQGVYDFTTKELEVIILHCNEEIELKQMNGPIVFQLPSAAQFADGCRIFGTSILFTEESTFDVVLKYSGKFYEHGSTIMPFCQPTKGEFVFPAGIPAGSLFTLRSDLDFNYYLCSKPYLTHQELSENEILGAPE